MRQKGSISMGPGASSLILIFVMLSLSVLAMLALTGGHNDREMSRRSVEVTEEIYALYEKAEYRRAEIAQTMAALREASAGEEEYLRGVSEDGSLSISDGMICWEEKDGVYTLDCAVALDGYQENSGEPAAWIRHKLLVDRAQAEEDWEEWN